MTTAAVPGYLKSNFNECPPGHRFTLYGEFWEGECCRRVKDIKPSEHLKSVSSDFPDGIKRLHNGLIKRQTRLAEASRETVQTYSAESASPFSTGMGIEHPLENGMAFLNPYGLPYLPGSSVKGTMRRTAEELAGITSGIKWDDNRGWTEHAVVALFGKEPPSGSDEAERGALTFWDVFPQCAKLSVEIMNPHYSNYYQREEAPHDAGSPVPIYFLTVPEKSRFVFHVQCDLHRLKENASLAEQWPKLIGDAFDHVFEWLGFGAKTAVGYGAMNRSDSIPTPKEHCEWVDETIQRLVKKHNATEDDTLRGQLLAKSWQAIEDLDLKREALADIRTRWKEKGWWDNPPPGKAKKALQIYKREN